MQCGMLVIQIRSAKPSPAGSLPFPHSPSPPEARAGVIIKRVLGHKARGRQVQLEWDRAFSNGFGSRTHCFLPGMGLNAQLSSLVSEQ